MSGDNPYSIPARPFLEAYISRRGDICLKQEDNYGADESIIAIEYRDVPKVIEWLESLYAERAKIPDENFPEDAAES